VLIPDKERDQAMISIFPNQQGNFGRDNKRNRLSHFQERDRANFKTPTMR
jgi:hypothetical protein